MSSYIKNSIAEKYYKVGNASLARGEHLIAIKNYEQALSINPHYYKAFCNLGVAYKNINNYAKSEDAFRKALSLNPRDSIVLNNLGNLYIDAKKFALAERSYLEALKINPQYRDVIYNLEQLYNALGKLGKAAEYRIKLEQLFLEEPLSDIDNVIISSK